MAKQEKQKPFTDGLLNSPSVIKTARFNAERAKLFDEAYAARKLLDPECSVSGFLADLAIEAIVNPRSGESIKMDVALEKLAALEDSLIQIQKIAEAVDQAAQKAEARGAQLGQVAEIARSIGAAQSALESSLSAGRQTGLASSERQERLLSALLDSVRTGFERMEERAKEQAERAELALTKTDACAKGMALVAQSLRSIVDDVRGGVRSADQFKSGKLN